MPENRSGNNDPARRIERRGVLSKIVPFAINAAWEAHAALSPGKLATVAVEEYKRIGSETQEQQRELEALIAGVSSLKLEPISTRRFRLRLGAGQVLDLLESHLARSFAREAKIGPGLTRSRGELVAQMLLPGRSVLGRVIWGSHSSDVIDLQKELERARLANPSETWIVIVTSDFEQRIDVQLDPIFVGENRILQGRFRVLSIADLLGEATGERFSASVDPKSLTEDSVSLILARKRGSQEIRKESSDVAKK